MCIFSREDVQTGLGILEKHDVTFDLYVVPGSLCHVATIAEKFPKLRMVIDHIGKPKVQVKHDLFHFEPDVTFLLCFKSG